MPTIKKCLGISLHRILEEPISVLLSVDNKIGLERGKRRELNLGIKICLILGQFDIKNKQKSIIN